MNARSDGHPQAGKVGRYPYGVTYKQGHPTGKPWIVKFRRNKLDIYVGVYATLADATLAASEFVRKEIECPRSPT